jgi:hypothetical protein
LSNKIVGDNEQKKKEYSIFRIHKIALGKRNIQII